MTLSVSRVLFVEGERVFVDVEHPLTLAGFEVCRRELWGSDVLIALGAQLLPTLRNYDIYAYETEELESLERDLGIVSDHLPELSAASHLLEEYIAERAGNIRAAVAWAKANGGVIVW